MVSFDTHHCEQDVFSFMPKSLANDMQSVMKLYRFFSGADLYVKLSFRMRSHRDMRLHSVGLMRNFVVLSFRDSVLDY